MLARMWSNRNFHPCKLVQPFWKTVWWFLTELLPYNPAIVLLVIYANELKTYVYTKTCTWMFTEALFITAKIWKQPRVLQEVDGTAKQGSIIEL